MGICVCGAQAEEKGLRIISSGDLKTNDVLSNGENLKYGGASNG